jgi:hypothetical protein
MSTPHGSGRRAGRAGLPLGWLTGPAATRALGFAPASPPAPEA